jgi:Mg-chelatase subunit ChlD
VRELFPRETAETVVGHALNRYGLTEIIADAEALAQLEPNESLLRTLLELRGHLPDAVLGTVRHVVRTVVDDLTRRIEIDVRRALAGRLNRGRHSPVPDAANFDVRGTVRRNLKNYDPARRQLVLQEVRFFERSRRRLTWNIVLCVDQSASMSASVIHAAVMAGILSGLPAFRVRLVVFDTNVVDLSGYADDPVELLMSVQLGGGTDIAKAMQYCAQLVENPSRTVLVLITDFCEGGSVADLQRVTRSLAEARVKLLGLAALDDGAEAFYDRGIAESLADCGMSIAALTPARLADWLVEVTR